MNAADAKQATRSLDPEQSVLGALLIDTRAIERMNLEPSDFWLDKHQAIYAAMLRLHAQGTPTDITLVAAELNGDLDRAGGPAYLAALSQLTPTSLHAEHYAALVREASRRRLVMQASRLANDSEAPVDAVIERVESMLARAKQKGPAGRPDWEDKGMFIKRLYERLTGPYANDDAGITTGITSLDRLMRGMKRGDLIMCAARPSIGKTSFGVTIFHHVAMNLREPSLFFSLEEKRERLAEKLIAIDSGLPWHTVTGHAMTDEQLEAFGKSTARLADSPLDVAPTSVRTIEEIRAAAMEARRKDGLRFVVVDYLQMIGLAGRRENRTLEIEALTRSLKELALDADCTVLCLTQLNREPEHRPGGDPVMSDMRNGGSQEQDADVVLMLSLPGGRRQEPRPAVEEIVCQVAKNRLGETGKVPLGFRGSLMQFVPLAIESRPAGLVDRVLHRHEEDPSWSC